MQEPAFLESRISERDFSSHRNSEPFHQPRTASRKDRKPPSLSRRAWRVPTAEVSRPKRHTEFREELTLPAKSFHGSFGGHFSLVPGKREPLTPRRKRSTTSPPSSCIGGQE